MNPYKYTTQKALNKAFCKSERPVSEYSAFKQELFELGEISEKLLNKASLQ